MFILYTIIIGIVPGFVASSLKSRFPIWLFLFSGFLGAIIGAGLSLGDSPLYLEYPILNIWTVPAVFAALFALATLLADRRKIVASIVTDLVIIGAIVFIIFAGSSVGEYSGLFREELERAGVERVGQPIEGFSAFIYLEALPGFKDADFDGVKSLEGVYSLEGTELVYTRTAGNPVTSAEDVISKSGYKTLLLNISNRLDVEAKSETDIATILEKLREADSNQSSYITDDFSIWHPEGWYPYNNNRSVFFTHDENLDIPANTDGFALGPWFQVTVEIIDIDELFAQNLWEEGSEFLISKENVLIKGMEGTRLVTIAAGADGEVLHYVFNPDEERVFILSHYPYIRGSQDTDDFERAVATFMPNYIIEGAGNGQTGILQFKSGVAGKVLLGPTCPVMKDPPDPSCADKGYATVVQVIDVTSSKSSPFATVESDEDGNYKVMLPPGLYKVQALGKKPFPRCESKTIDVELDIVYEVDLLCDTGIR